MCEAKYKRLQLTLTSQNFTLTWWAISLTLSGYSCDSSILTCSSSCIRNLRSRSRAFLTSTSSALSSSMLGSESMPGLAWHWMPSSDESELLHSMLCSVLMRLTIWLSRRPSTSCCPFRKDPMTRFSWQCCDRRRVFSCSKVSMYSEVCCSMAA